jgi:hypothetical protein
MEGGAGEINQRWFYDYPRGVAISVRVTDLLILGSIIGSPSGFLSL